MTHKNHIEKLIQEMCPNGVNYMPLGEVCRSIAAPKKLQKKDYQTSGLYPIIDQGKAYIIGYTDDQTALLPKNDYVLFGDHTREIKFVNFAFAQGADGLKILLAKQNVLPRYLYYCLLNLSIPSRGYNRHWSIVSELSIPLPPVAIQEEIVRILDAFANLIENIDTEIKERERQLDCALNANYNSDFAKVQISTLGTITRGRRFVRTDIVEQGIPCIHYGDIYTRYPICVNKALTYLMGDITKKMRYAKNGDVIYVGAGENDEDIGMAIAWLGSEPAAVHDACYILSNHQQDAKYLAYMSRANNFHQQLKMSVASGKICSIPPDGLGRVRIPLPPLAEQRAIAEKLDTIEAFIANLKEERALRQQQYEYYREYLINLLK